MQKSRERVEADGGSFELTRFFGDGKGNRANNNARTEEARRRKGADPKTWTRSNLQIQGPSKDEAGEPSYFGLWPERLPDDFTSRTSSPGDNCRTEWESGSGTGWGKGSWADVSIKSFLRIGVDCVCFDVLDVDYICLFGQAVYDGRY